MERFVEPPKRGKRRRQTGERTSRLNADVRRWLRSAHLFSTNVADISRRRVVANYPIQASAGLFAEFALQNGTIHVMETLDFRGVDKLSKFRVGDTAYKSVLLDQAKEASPEGRRFALIAANDYEAVRPAINMIREYADDVIAYESVQDRRRLADFLASALHAPQLPVALSP
jgi:hypothetical protein